MALGEGRVGWLVQNEGNYWHLSESERCESFPRFVQVPMRPNIFGLLATEPAFQREHASKPPRVRVLLFKHRGMLVLKCSSGRCVSAPTVPGRGDGTIKGMAGATG